MAFPTRSDLDFYRSKQPLPAWVQKIEPRPKMPYVDFVSPVDILVAAHAGIKHSSGEIAVHNLLSIVRSYRRRGLDLARELQRIAERPECAINPEKRAAFARKWARRLA